MISDSKLQLMFKQPLTIEFWCSIKGQAPQLFEKYIKIFLPFLIIYLCKSGFSLNTSMKITHFNRLNTKHMVYLRVFSLVLSPLMVLYCMVQVWPDPKYMHSNYTLKNGDPLTHCDIFLGQGLIYLLASISPNPNRQHDGLWDSQVSLSDQALYSISHKNVWVFPFSVILETADSRRPLQGKIRARLMFILYIPVRILQVPSLKEHCLLVY